jgi:hypothetical protein
MVLDRRRVTLCPDELPRQAYHAAQGLPRSRAAALVAEVEAAVTRTTTAVVDELVAVATARGRLVAVAVIGRPRDRPGLDDALANHSMLHAAEGELYRAALDEAADGRGIPVIPAAPNGTIAEAAAAIGRTGADLTARLAGLRTELGAPWQADHKAATAAALMALHLRS